MRQLTADELKKLTSNELAEYHEVLEELYWEAGKTSFRDFCQRVEVPGAPIPDEDAYYCSTIEPAKHHDLLIDGVQALAEGRYPEIDGIMAFLPPGSAKALALDTPIPTPSGWSSMGDLKVGDKVFDETGKPCSVTWVSPIHKNRPVYSVLTDCGDEIVADRDHEWPVRLCQKHGKISIKETWELARKRSKRPMIKRAEPLALDQADLPIDPYVLGVWLGDGTHASGQITLNEDDADHIVSRIQSAGYVVSKNKAKLHWHINGLRGRLSSLGMIHDTWREIDGRKYIPPEYLRASVSQRIALLQGLIDTDGTVCKRRGCATFCSTSRELADGVRELVRSLGVKAGWSESRAMLYGKDCGAAYKVSFYHESAASAPRKANGCRDQYRTPNTYIDVLEAGFADTVCIEVDSPSHLFLCGRSMTPTHNSTYLSVLAPPWLMGRRPGTNVIACSYGQDLANRFGRRVRHIARSVEYEHIMGTTITGDNQAVDNWSLLNGSDYRAAGMGAAVTGFRADWLLVDDPLKGREDADSETIRDKVYSGLMDDLMTRLKPGGKIIIALTRWHEDDPAGRILGEDWKGQSGLWRGTDGRLWLIINLPLIAENKDDPLGRAEGQLLWPEWFRQEEADRLQAAGKKGGTAARTWSSLYQQRPAPHEGAILVRHYWQEWKEKDLPEVDQVYLCYDTAFEEGEENDYSAMSAWGVFTNISKKASGHEYRHNHVILLGYWEDKINAVDLLKTVQLHCEKFRPDRVLIEKRASGIQLIEEMRRRRIPVKPWLPRGKPGSKGKIPRGHAVAAILEQGSVWYVKGTRTERLLDQCSAFPYGTHDDGVDTVTMALTYFRDKWIFMTKDDELDEKELEEALLHRSDQRRSNRSLYGGKRANRKDQIELDEIEISTMSDDTRKRLWDERTKAR